MTPHLCDPQSHEWVFCEGEEQVGLTEGYYCRLCGAREDDLAALSEDDQT